MLARIATCVALLATALLPLHAAAQVEPRRATPGLPAPATDVTKALSRTINRISNTATLTAVTETGLRAVHEGSVHRDLHRMHRASRYLRLASRGGRTAGLARKTLRFVGRTGRMVRPLGQVLNTIFGISSFGLIADAGYRLHHGKDRPTRLGALRDLGAGICGLGRLGIFVRPLSARFGLVGGCLQAGVGAANIYRGVRAWDRDLLISGTLDLCGGSLLVVGSCAIGEPYASFGAAAFTAGRLLYDSRKTIRKAAVRGWQALRGGLRQIGARLMDQATLPPSEAQSRL